MPWEHANTPLGDNYYRFCHLASHDDGLFSSFKREPAYTACLSHVTVEEGQIYLDAIQDRYPDLLQGSYRCNDQFGNPRTHRYFGLRHAVDPSTLRYLKQVGDIRSTFGSTLPRIAEIGGGYGGLCLLLKAYLHNDSYRIYDHESVEPFVRRYLGNHNIALDCDESEYDLVVSNWAWDELELEDRQWYIDHVFKRSKRGYLTARVECIEAHEWGGRAFQSLQMEETGRGHLIITWDDSSYTKNRVFVRPANTKEQINFMCTHLRGEAAPLRQSGWHTLAGVASEQGIASLLHRTLCTHSNIPQVTSDELRNQAHDVALRNLVASCDLQIAVQALRSVGVNNLVLQDAASQLLLYDVPNDRELRRAVLLVQPKAVEEALSKLASAGFLPAKKQPDLRFALRFESATTVYQPGEGRTPIVVRWHLHDVMHYRSSVDVDWFWANSMNAGVGNKKLCVLNPAADLLYLATLLAPHEHSRIIELYDVVLLLERHSLEIDWGDLIDRADKMDLLPPFRATLMRVERRWPGILPQVARELLARRIPNKESVDVFARQQSAVTKIQRFWDDALSLKTTGSRLQYAYARLSKRLIRSSFVTLRGEAAPCAIPPSDLL